MTILDLAHQLEPVLAQAAVLLVEHFDEPRGWPTLAAAREEVARVLADGPTSTCRRPSRGERSEPRW